MRGSPDPSGVFDHTLMWTDRPAASRRVVDVSSGQVITLFAFMFGSGSHPMERAERSGVASRRLRASSAILSCWACCLRAHLVGDILAPYALMGFLLLLFRKRSQKAVLRWSAVLYAYPLLFAGLLLTLHTAGVRIPSPPPATQEELQRLIGVYATGSYANIVTQNFKSLPFMGFGLIFFYPRVLGVFLFGLWVWRRGIIRDLPSRTDLLRQCQRHGLWIGLLFNTAAVVMNEALHPNPLAPSVAGLIINLLFTIGVPAGSLFYASTLALLWQKVHWRERLKPFGAVGRTALTNYLLQSVVCTTIYYSWGGGLYGRVNPLMGFVPTLVVYARKSR